MELKQFYVYSIPITRFLLIVPYGIETADSVFESEYQLRLLIVPYGIETALKEAWRRAKVLLIVPYGIETSPK